MGNGFWRIEYKIWIVNCDSKVIWRNLYCKGCGVKNVECYFIIVRFVVWIIELKFGWVR